MLSMMLAMAVAAQPVERPEWFVRSSEAETYQGALELYGSRALQHFAGVDCSTAVVSALEAQPMMVSDVPGTSGPVQGLRERVRVEGCGQSSIQNLIVVRPDPDRSWSFTFAVPGESILQWIQQDYVLRQLTATVQKSKPGCESVRLTDTYVVANPGYVIFGPALPPREGEPTFGVSLPGTTVADNKIDPKLAWAELWIFDACGAEHGVGVAMMPTYDRNFIPLPVPMGDYPRSAWPTRATPKPSGEVSSGL